MAEPFGPPLALAPWYLPEFDGPAKLRPCLQCAALARSQLWPESGTSARPDVGRAQAIALLAIAVELQAIRELLLAASEGAERGEGDGDASRPLQCLPVHMVAGPSRREIAAGRQSSGY